MVGRGIIEIFNPLLAAEVQMPFTERKVYLPALETVIVWVVSPVLHKFPVAIFELKVATVPAQILFDPVKFVIVGTAGIVVTFIAIALLDALVQSPLVFCTE